MKREELKEFILQNFPFVAVEFLEAQKVEVFRVDLAKLADLAKSKIAEGADLGEFERETFEKQLSNFENTEEHTPIFAILHQAEFPVSFEVKTGAQLARLLREKESVVPSKLMSEREWSKIIGFGQISKEEAEDLLRLSFRSVTE
ncbi:MAG: hypothetical protein Q4A27_02105 [bacterium]|nr:hypothetical protein [bacterium]